MLHKDYFGAPKKILLILLLSSLVSDHLYPQVTIGSGNPPYETGLLQLKDQEPDTENVTSTQGGLLLSRVKLASLTALYPFVDTLEGNYENHKLRSVGLVVYNVADTDKVDPGMYVWDGAKWISISSSISGGEDPKPPIGPDPEINDISDPEALRLPNSYILPQNHILEISVIKGYAVWAYDIGKAISLDENPTVELLWQSKPDLITSLSLTEGAYPYQSKIKVESNGLNGNALIGIKVDGVIRWSWHIWVTDYDPENPEGQRKSGDVIFMDRNLGSLYLSRNGRTIFSIGMLYQWGRKDPFPATANLVNDNMERPLYKIDNCPALVNKEYISENSIDNRGLSCSNPQTFYLSKGGDWYSDNKDPHHYLWSKAGTNEKGIYDPCPRGWRVPNQDSWDNLPIDGNYTSDADGLDWSKPNSGYTGGHYPYSGFRTCEKGDITMKKEGNLITHLWCNYNDYWLKEKAYRLFFSDHYISLPSTRTSVPKAQGNAVRCIQDKVN